jgi:outer membrane murein-binding lipoprotein Lpp
MINSLLAYELRTEFGCTLNPNAEFSNPRLKQIAEEMDDLNKKWDALDAEIKAMRIEEFGAIPLDAD